MLRKRWNEDPLMKFEQMVSVVVLGVLSWGSMQLYQMKADLSVVTYKVDENYKMIKPMWQDFLIRSDVASNDR
jgi:hypothetical protein